MKCSGCGKEVGKGICMTGDLFLEMLKNKWHEYDGDNCVQQGCG